MEIHAQGKGHTLHVRLCGAEVATQIIRIRFSHTRKGRWKEIGEGEWKGGMRQEVMGTTISPTSSVIFATSII